MSVSYTPMMEQYREVKRRYPDTILFFRLGDFYEMFFDDAELAARELEITLTGRDAGQAGRVPMCGVPYHAAESYIARLINKGYRVAICEQVEDPKEVKGIVRREVIRVITPGTVLTDALLADKGNNFLALLYQEEETLYLAAADVSTAECMWTEFGGAHRLTGLCDQLFRLGPAEIVLAGKISGLSEIEKFTASRLPRCTYTRLAADSLTEVGELPGRHFAADELPAAEGARTAVALLLHYLYQTVKSDLSHLSRLSKFDAGEHLALDAATLRNLEVTTNMRDGSKRDTLLAVLDLTKTAMGGRLLKKWLECPLVSRTAIEDRLDAVGELVANGGLRLAMQQFFAEVYDFERILTRIEVGTANARDLTALRASLAVLPAVKDSLGPTAAKLLAAGGQALATHADVTELIANAIVDAPPLAVREGGMIRPGYDLELDELRAIAHDSRQFVQDLEAREREATGIKSLKVGYNKVFGYYLEVTNANTAAVPLTYTRKQTLANAERYITPELKEFEIKILGAQEKIVAIEYHLFCQARDYVKARIREIQQTARLVAELDVLTSLAEAAVRGGYVRPRLGTNREIVIRDGRHPVVEKLLKRELFVPNDTDLNHHDGEIMIITGPNMAGKSTYMRQVALLVLMTQAGSFIPAREAAIGPVDRIFTRVGASDDLATGQSTFMMEMNEVAAILRHATANSLVILDEIGRGTSTFDGMSIARAVIEYIRDKVHAKTLFATHYHELTELEETSRKLKNYSVAVKERGNDVVFLRRIVAGGADKSYGIHVAQLAGLPKKVIERAQEILAELEAGHHQQQAAGQAAATATPAAPLSLFTSSLAEELLALDIMTITPLEAMNILYKLQAQAKQEAGKL